MKGPGFRLDLDVRRMWECPVCGRRLKFTGSVAQVACDCRVDTPPIMRLIEPIHRTESPFDHVGHAAQKRIDAAIRKPDGSCEADAREEFDDEELRQAAGVDATSAGELNAESPPLEDAAEDRRPPDESLPETTHELDADAPPPTIKSSDEPADDQLTA